MKDAFWFQHDSNARTDARILELRAEMGWEGYGLWWAIVEKLREATDYKLSNTTLGGLSMDLAMSKAETRKFLDVCIALGLLQVEEDCFYAPALRRRMEAWDAKRNALAEAGKRGAARRWAGDKPEDAPALPPQKPGDSQANGHPIATPLATPIAIREENSTEEKKTEEDSTEKKEEPPSFHSEGSAPAEVKILPLVPSAEELPSDSSNAQAPHTRGARPAKATKPKVAALAFADSPYASLESVQAALAGTDYAHADLAYYHEVIRNWAEGKGEKKVDWLAAIRGWILRDSKENKLKTNSTTYQANGYGNAQRFAGSNHRAETFGDVGRAVDLYVASKYNQ